MLEHSNWSSMKVNCSSLDCRQEDEAKSRSTNRKLPLQNFSIVWMLHILTFESLPFSPPYLHIWEKSLSGFKGLSNRIQKRPFVVNRNLGTPLTSVSLWHLSRGCMQGIMRNTSLHLLHLCVSYRRFLTHRKLKGQKCLSIIILLPLFPHTQPSVFWCVLIFCKGQPRKSHTMTVIKYD